MKRAHRIPTLLFWVGLAILTGCASPQGERLQWTPPPEPPTVDPADTELAAAQRSYNIYCAHCHGWMGEGQGEASEQRTRELGYDIVPRHDALGNTWEHPDQLLFEAIKHGIDDPLNLYIMAEYGSRLSDEEIWGVIEYMKRFWTEEQRDYQARLTAQFAVNQPDWEP